MNKKQLTVAWVMGIIICFSLAVFIGGNITIRQISHSISQSFNKLDNRVADLDNRVTDMETKVKDLNLKIEQMTTLQQQIAQNVNLVTELKEKIANLDEAIKQIHEQQTNVQQQEQSTINYEEKNKSVAQSQKAEEKDDALMSKIRGLTPIGVKKILGNPISKVKSKQGTRQSQYKKDGKIITVFFGENNRVSGWSE